MKAKTGIIMKIFIIMIIIIAMQIFSPCIKTFAVNNIYSEEQEENERKDNLEEYQKILENFLIDIKKTVVSTKIEQEQEMYLTEEMIQDGYNAETIKKDETVIELNKNTEEIIDNIEKEESINEQIGNNIDEKNELDNEEKIEKDEEIDINKEIDEKELEEESEENIESDIETDIEKTNETNEELEEIPNEIQEEQEEKNDIINEEKIVAEDPQEIEVSEQPKDKVVEDIIESEELAGYVIEENAEEIVIEEAVQEEQEVKIQLLNTNVNAVKNNINTKAAEVNEEKAKNTQIKNNDENLEKNTVEIAKVENNKETIIKQEKQIETMNSKERRDKQNDADLIKMTSLGLTFLGGMALFITALVITNRHNVEIYIEEKTGEEPKIGGKDKINKRERSLNIDSYLLKGESFKNPVKIMLSKNLSKKLNGKEIKITHRGNIINRVINYKDSAVELILD